MKLDKAIYTAGQIADLAQTDILNVHTWTTRGFADPYHAKPRFRRGRGRVRSYTLRDGLRFFLMARLHKQYRTPLPQGLQVCHAVFGESFDPKTAAYLLLRENVARTIELQWCKDATEVGLELGFEPLSTVINVKHIYDSVCAEAQRILRPAHE